MGKVRRGGSRAELWRVLLARQRRSGLSIRRFCRDESISEPSFYWWRRELAHGRRTRLDVSRTKRAASARFVNVSLLAGAAMIELELAGGRRLRIPPGCDESTLATVLRVLESPSC